MGDRECLHRRPIAWLAWTIALLLVGVWTLLTLPIERIPAVTTQTVTIRAWGGSASAEWIERNLTVPIERVVQGVAGTAGVQSFSEPGSATLRITVSNRADIALYLAELGGQLSFLQSVLPRGTLLQSSRDIPKRLDIRRPLMTVAVVGDGAPNSLRLFAEEHIAPTLRRAPGVGSVDIEGGSDQEVRITLLSDRLAIHGIRPGDLRAPLQQALSDSSYGHLSSAGRNVALLRNQTEDVQELANLVLSRGEDEGHPVKLSHVARVELVPSQVKTFNRIDGQPVIALVVRRTPDSHLVQVARSIHARLDELRGKLPPGVRLLVGDDEAEETFLHFKKVIGPCLAGLALALALLTVVTRGLRAPAGVFLAFIVTLALACILLRIFEFSLNTLTIAGLVLSCSLSMVNGMLVVLQGDRVRRASLALPVLGGILSSLSAVAPLAFGSIELRRYLLLLTCALGVALLLSCAAARILLPCLGLVSSGRTRPSCFSRWYRQLALFPSHAATRWPRTALLLLCLFVGLPSWLLPERLEVRELEAQPLRKNVALAYNRILGAGPVLKLRRVVDRCIGGVSRPFFTQIAFGPQWSGVEPNEIFAQIVLPPGSGLDRSDRLIREFEKTALSSGSVQQAFARAEGDAAYLRLRFSDATLRTSAPIALRQELIERALQLDGIEISVGGILPIGYSSSSGGMVSNLEVEALGSNYEKLDRLIGDFAQRVEGLPRIAEVDVNQASHGSSFITDFLQFRWNTNGSHTRVKMGEIASDLQYRIPSSQSILHSQMGGERRLPVRVVWETDQDPELGKLAQSPILAGQKLIRLAAWAAFSVEQKPPVIERLNQQYRRRIRINYRGPQQLGEALLQDAVEAMPLPPGYKLKCESPLLFSLEDRSSFWITLVLASALLYLALAAVSESWTLPMAALCGLPCAVAGTGVIFILLKSPFHEGAMLGAILAAALTINQTFRWMLQVRLLGEARRGASRAVLALLASRRCLREAWISTSMVTAGIIPLLLTSPAGSFATGFAAVVVGGLSGSLLLGPIALSALMSLRNR